MIEIPDLDDISNAGPQMEENVQRNCAQNDMDSIHDFFEEYDQDPELEEAHCHKVELRNFEALKRDGYENKPKQTVTQSGIADDISQTVVRNDNQNRRGAGKYNNSDAIELELHQNKISGKAHQHESNVDEEGNQSNFGKSRFELDSRDRSRKHAPQSISEGKASNRDNLSTFKQSLLGLPFLVNENFSRFQGGQLHERRNLATSSKTPAEYSLHIIFTKFVRLAERKLSICLQYSSDEEPPIAEIMGEGADKEFDKVIVSLAYVARKKPKHVIDSVMFWRKSKCETSVLNGIENVETKDKELPPASRQVNVSPNNNQKGSSFNSKAKRSLSIMRSKSLSRLKGVSLAKSTSEVNQKQKQSPTMSQGTLYSNTMPFKQSTFSNNSKNSTILAERKSLALIYIFCRVLIEVVKECPFDDDLGERMEEIFFAQLRFSDPAKYKESAMRFANWNMFAELLGHMSEKRFLSVSDRFIASLEVLPVKLNAEDENMASMLIQRIKCLNLKNYPMEKFEESAEFLLSLAKFYLKAQNENVLLSYCDVLSYLIEHLGKSLTAEINHPTWLEAISKIFNKSSATLKSVLKEQSGGSNTTKNQQNWRLLDESVDLWSASMRLTTACVCVHSRELFSNTWFSLIEEISIKLKAKLDLRDKVMLVFCISRLLWTYLYRFSDTLNNTVKKLDNFFNLLLFNNNSMGKKQQWIVFNEDLINAMATLIRIVGFQYLNYTLENVLLRLLRLGYNSATNEIISPEKLLILIKSYFFIIYDYEFSLRPSFPTKESLRDLRSLGTRTEGEEKKLQNNEFIFVAKDSTNAFVHEEICKSFGSVFRQLDYEFGMNALGNLDPGAPSSTSRSHSAFSAFRLDFSYNATKDFNIDIFIAILEVSHWILVPLSNESVSCSGLPFQLVVQILTRNVLHPNRRIAETVLTTLRKMASKGNPRSLVAYFAKYAFHLSDKPEPVNIELSLGTTQELLAIYVSLLTCWLEELSSSSTTSERKNSDMPRVDELMNKDVLHELYEINVATDYASDRRKVTPVDEIEWKTIITVIEEIEGNGLFFLCYQDSLTRHYAIQILELVEKFDQAVFELSNNGGRSSDNTNLNAHSRSSSKFAADEGTRLIHVLQNTDFLELIRPIRKELSSPERTRVSKMMQKKNVLVKLAESDFGIDSTLWFRLYPKVLDIFFEKCPMPVAMCRSIVCARLVQLYELVFDYSESYSTFTSSLFSQKTPSIAPEVVINQWRLYLVYACCSLTSTNEQKISIPTKATHGRKRSMQMFLQHQKITSAKSVFRMVIPLLKSPQQMVRDAVISGVSCLNINIFKTFLESVPLSLNEWDKDSDKRDFYEDQCRVGLVQILNNITSRFHQEDLIFSDEWMVANLMSVVKNVKSFLSSSNVQVDVNFQKLRRYFSGLLENVVNGLVGKADLERWFPFEARISCFNYLKSWCGFGSTSDLADGRYNTMMENCKERKNMAPTIAIVELERKALQYASLSCMTALCASPIHHEINVGGKSVIMSVDIPEAINWVDVLLHSDNEIVVDLGRNALRNILKYNINDDEIYQIVMKKSFESQSTPKVAECYLLPYTEALMTLKNFESVPKELIGLCLVLVGNNNPSIRSSALELLIFLEKKFFGTSDTYSYRDFIISKSFVVYKKALLDISSHYVNNHPEDVFYFISYLSMILKCVDTEVRRDVFTCLIPWVDSIELQHEKTQKSPTETKIDFSTLMVLDNFLEYEVAYGQELPTEVESAWMSLARNPSNFEAIFEYLVHISLSRKNSKVVEYVCRIMGYLANENLIITTDKLIAGLGPRSMVPPLQEKSVDSGKFCEYPYFSDVWETTFEGVDAVFSIGQISMIFLTNLIALRSDQILERLPLLLHVSFSLLDHYNSIVQESASILLIQIVTTLGFDDKDSAELLQSLKSHDRLKHLWIYDDLNTERGGGRTPRNMDLLIRRIMDAFDKNIPSLQEDWSQISLHWATTCAVRHIACRSFQIFRSLLTSLNHDMLRDMLHRLSNTIADESPDIQGFAMQILMTLNAITAELDFEKLIEFPQLFWSGVACLSTVHEREFIEVLSTISKFLLKIDLDAPDTISCLISTFPPKWEGRFEGLVQVVLVGLRSATTWELTVKFLDKLNHFQDSEIIGQGDYRLLMVLLANMPRYLHSFDDKNLREIGDSASTLSVMAENSGKGTLARILFSLAKGRFRSKKDFLRQSVATINDFFFPAFEVQALVFVLGLLSNRISWIRLETLLLLKQFFPLINLGREEFVGVGADLISPLLRLLLTDEALPALEVLDKAEAISGSELDRDILRMSLGNNNMKREYDNTATLFGMPDRNGWSIPMPSITAATTRNNVHSVFLTINLNSVTEEETKDEGGGTIQFLEENYVPLSDYTENQYGAEEPEASLSNMWAALDDFDSFFTKDDHNIAESVTNISRGIKGHYHKANPSLETQSSDSTHPTDSASVVYDKKASVILNRSLARTESNSSFRNRLSDSIAASNQENPIRHGLSKMSHLPFRHSRHSARQRHGELEDSRASNFSSRLDTPKSPLLQRSYKEDRTLSPENSHASAEGSRMLDNLIWYKKKPKKLHRKSSSHSDLNYGVETIKPQVTTVNSNDENETK